MDVAENESIESKLMSSEQRSREWLENSPVCTKIIDIDFNLQYMSRAGIAGLKIEDVTAYYGKPYPFHFFPEWSKKSMIEGLEKVKKTGQVTTMEMSALDLEGKELWFYATLTPMKSEDDQIENIMVVSTDITKRKEAEKRLEVKNQEIAAQIGKYEKLNDELHQSNVELIRAKEEAEAERRQKLTSLIDGQEIERGRFAKELHDGLGQMLTAAVHNIRKIKHLGQLNDEQSQVLDETLSINQLIIEETRRISKNLMPAVLEDFGLVLALQNMVNSTSSSSSTIRFHGCKQVPRFSKETEVALYRIAQEALNNAIKYSNAADIYIDLKNEQDKVILSIVDNGKGLDVMEQMTNEATGLTNMKERAELVGADFTVESDGSSYTEVKVVLSQ